MGGEVRIGRVQLHVPFEELQHLAGGLVPVPNGDDQVPRLGGYRPVDHQDVPVADAGAAHGPAIGAVQERGGRVAYQQAMQVDRIVHEVVGRRREAKPRARCGKGHELRRAIDHGRADWVGQRMGVGKGLHGRTLVAACLTGRDGAHVSTITNCWPRSSPLDS